MRKRKMWLALGLVIMFSLIAGPVAWAHDTRDVAGGKYQFRVGFIVEPTYQGLENGIELTVCTGTCSIKDGIPTNGVLGVFDTLKAEVIFGDQNLTLPLIPVPRTPGRYNARFVPTRVGDYTFHFFGTINNDKIDEKFTSGPNTFDSVLPLTVIQFPDKPGYSTSSATAPATTNPATPVRSVVPETTVAVAAVVPTPTVLANVAPTVGTPNSVELQSLKTQLQEQKAQLDSAKASATGASTLAIVGLVTGIAGIIIAGLALFLLYRGNRPRRKPEAG